MSVNAMVEAMMVAARIHFSWARVMDGGIGVLFMVAALYGGARVQNSETPSFDCAFPE
jgi:hypothetical protein